MKILKKPWGCLPSGTITELLDELHLAVGDVIAVS